MGTSGPSLLQSPASGPGLRRLQGVQDCSPRPTLVPPGAQHLCHGVWRRGRPCAPCPRPDASLACMENQSASFQFSAVSQGCELQEQNCLRGQAGAQVRLWVEGLPVSLAAPPVPCRLTYLPQVCAGRECSSV